MATGYGAERPMVRCSNTGRGKILPLSTSSRPVLVLTQHPIQWVPGLKLLEREADHSPPTGAEIENSWIYTSLPVRLHGVVLS
jgi:hypothetical protein